MAMNTTQPTRALKRRMPDSDDEGSRMADDFNKRRRDASGSPDSNNPDCQALSHLTLDYSDWYDKLAKNISKIELLRDRILRNPRTVELALFAQLNELFSLLGRELFEYHAWNALAYSSEDSTTSLSVEGAEKLKQSIIDQLSSAWISLPSADQEYWQFHSANLKRGLRDHASGILVHLQTTGSKQGSVATKHIQMAENGAKGQKYSPVPVVEFLCGSPAGSTQDPLAIAATIVQNLSILLEAYPGLILEARHSGVRIKYFPCDDVASIASRLQAVVSGNPNGSDPRERFESLLRPLVSFNQESPAFATLQSIPTFRLFPKAEAKQYSLSTASCLAFLTVSQQADILSAFPHKAKVCGILAHYLKQHVARTGPASYCRSVEAKEIALGQEPSNAFGKKFSLATFDKELLKSLSGSVFAVSLKGEVNVKAVLDRLEQRVFAFDQYTKGIFGLSIGAEDSQQKSVVDEGMDVD